jgi:hypothetical protein
MGSFLGSFDELVEGGSQCIEFGDVGFALIDGLGIDPFAGRIIHPVGIDKRILPFSSEI